MDYLNVGYLYCASLISRDNSLDDWPFLSVSSVKDYHNVEFACHHLTLIGYCLRSGVSGMSPIFLPNTRK